MSALAAIQAPLSYGRAVELGNRTWAKKILPIGEISYKGRTLRFDRPYLGKLVDAFRDGAYDQVPLQLADSGNNHTNDPERTAGWIEDMELREDGLYALASVTERGERVLSENPMLGVSARIVEQYERADGRYYPAAVQHVLATLDPRVTGLGAWTPVDMANDATLVIDLSQASWLGEDAADLTDQELADLMDAMSEAEAEDPGGDDLSDAELEALVAEVDGLSDEDLAQLEADADAEGALEGLADEFEAGFGRLAATAQVRQAADAEDAALAAARAKSGHVERDEDKLARSLQRLADGTHPAQEFSNPAGTAIELAARSIAGTCGPPDPVSGLCINTGHQPGCRGYLGSDGDDVDLADSGAYVTALAELGLPSVNGAGVLELSGDRSRPGYPQRTVELARAVYTVAPDLAGSGGPTAEPEPSWDDLLGPSYSGDPYSDLAREIGHGELAEVQPRFTGYPDVSGLRQAMGL